MRLYARRRGASTGGPPPGAAGIRWRFTPLAVLLPARMTNTQAPSTKQAPRPKRQPPNEELRGPQHASPGRLGRPCNVGRDEDRLLARLSAGGNRRRLGHWLVCAWSLFGFWCLVFGACRANGYGAGRRAPGLPPSAGRPQRTLSLPPSLTPASPTCDTHLPRSAIEATGARKVLFLGHGSGVTGQQPAPMR